MSKILNIALVAHDSRKKELLNWFEFNIHKLCKHNLYATGTTGKLMQKVIDDNQIATQKPVPTELLSAFEARTEPCKINCLLSGPLGGDSMIGAMIAQGTIDVLFFFCDNLIMQGHQQDISALTRLASLYNIAFATNRTTADMLITSPLFEDENYKRIIPSVIEQYANRKI